MPQQADSRADLDFRCSQCGNCCKGLWLPLSIAEAQDWLEDGNAVAVLCQAIPWPAEPSAIDVAAAYKRARSFAARAGSLPIRVQVALAAPQGYHCPHLQPDNRCAIYHRRPSVCRAYPAEPNPMLSLHPQQRACTADCWQPGGTPLLRNGRYVDAGLRQLLVTVGERAIVEAPAMQQLCETLGIRAAALANEGYAAHLPSVRALAEALSHASAAVVNHAGDWHFIASRAASITAIRDCGAVCMPAETTGSTPALQYINLMPESGSIDSPPQSPPPNLPVRPPGVCADREYVRNG